MRSTNDCIREKRGPACVEEPTKEGGRAVSEAEQSRNLVIPVEKVPVAAFQAIYHHITKKTERLNKAHKGSFKLTADNLEDLFRQVEQSIAQYQVKGDRCEITVSLSNGEVYSYSSFEKFAMVNFGVFIHPTSSIGFEYDFMIVLPSDDIRGESITQRYKVGITIRSNEDSDDHIVVVGGRMIREISVFKSPIMTSIEYSDYAVARHMQSMLNEWIGHLRYNDENVISEKSAKMIRRVSGYGVFFLAIAVFLGSVLFEPSNYEDYITPIRYLVLVISTAIAATAFGFWSSEKIDSLVSTLTPRTVILLTHGDTESRDKLVAKRSSARKQIAYIVTGIIIATVVSIFANYLSSFLLANG